MLLAAGAAVAFVVEGAVAAGTFCGAAGVAPPAGGVGAALADELDLFAAGAAGAGAFAGLGGGIATGELESLRR